MDLMGNLNSYFQNQLDSSNCELLPQDIKDGVQADFIEMSYLGIDNEDDQGKFFLVQKHVPEICKSVFNVKVNDKTAKAVAIEVFKNREKKPLGTLLELIEAIGLALKKMVPNNIKAKLAYPQPFERQQLPKYDIGRWVDATRKVYELMVKGQPQDQAKQSVIGNWERSEIMDYENWLKYYKERGPEKYPKLAFTDFGNSDLLLGGIPVNTLKAVLPTRGGQGHATKVSPGLVQSLPHDVNEVRDKIESQRRKLISRLNSAEKMLASLDGQLFAGDDQELMLKLLQDLKRRIQTANKLTAKSTLFSDYIYRTGNQLKRIGKDKAAGFFYKIAQLPPLDGPPDSGLDMPDMSEPSSPAGGANKQETHDLLKEFFDNLKRGVSDENDEPEEREKIEKGEVPVKAEPAPAPVEPAPTPEAPTTASHNIDRIKIGDGFWKPALVSLAQLPPPRAPQPKLPSPIAPPKPPMGTKPLPVPAQVSAPDSQEPVDNTDDVIEAALKNVSVNDVINRLEMLVSIYNQREISRQLAILDIMMGRLGIASFFPSLGEAMGKGLEANQYIGSRLGEILSRLKGSVDSPGASDWIEVTNKDTPETEGLRNTLEQKKQQEERQREMRKQKEVAKLEGTEPSAGAPGVPSAPVSVGDVADLQKPSRVEKLPKIDVR